MSKQQLLRIPYASPCRVLFWLVISAAVLPDSARAQDQLHGWQVIAAADAPTLAEVNETGDMTSFLLKNSSDRTITAFVVKLGTNPEAATHTLDCFDAEQSCVKPDATYALRWPTDELRRSPTRAFTIMAVFFEDGSSQGSRDEIEFIKARRLGIILETAQIARFMHGLTDLNDAPSMLARTKQHFEKIPETPEQCITAVSDAIVAGVSMEHVRALLSNPQNRLYRHAILVGVSGARERMLNRLEQIGQLKDADRAALLLEFREHYVELNAKHSKYCRRLINAGISIQ